MTDAINNISSYDLIEEEAIIIGLRLNKALVKVGVKDRKFYLARNQKRKENFWIFVFQCSQVRWFMKIKLSGSPEELEGIQSDKSIGTLGFLESWHHIETGNWCYVKKDVEGTIISKVIRDVLNEYANRPWNWHSFLSLECKEKIEKIGPEVLLLKHHFER